MHKNEEFRKKVEEMFKMKILDLYFPHQKYLDFLISSLSLTEANSYNNAELAFITKFNSTDVKDLSQFIHWCLNQLLWVNSILESEKYCSKSDDIEEFFDYPEPSVDGDHWILSKVIDRGLYFYHMEDITASKVIINSANITGIAESLSKAKNKSNLKKENQIILHNDDSSTLFINKDIEERCINVLKTIKHPVLDEQGAFINSHGMIAAIVFWYYKCKVLSFISKDSSTTRDNISKELMELIPNLSIESSNLSQNTKAKKYKEDIENKLNEIADKLKETH
ncbi:hypothetical protein KO506_06975 [Polaribacter vadi]|uniref:hypothetical protein n=1 Tax=Polaribacter TaxID=52959 RepID=UPI001C092311|nr:MULTISPECIES: hypothetical protein [Polaribacter]MBU3011139.1 hypothetical protein [Polaribacter vadi]MDO6740953.1 hypothetical protein [Polaribacter sp. 1_MG-2023]